MRPSLAQLLPHNQSHELILADRLQTIPARRSYTACLCNSASDCVAERRTEELTYVWFPTCVALAASQQSLITVLADSHMAYDVSYFAASAQCASNLRSFNTSGLRMTLDLG